MVVWHEMLRPEKDDVHNREVVQRSAVSLGMDTIPSIPDPKEGTRNTAPTPPLLINVFYLKVRIWMKAH
jgi:hypothetical protein